MDTVSTGADSLNELKVLRNNNKEMVILPPSVSIDITFRHIEYRVDVGLFKKEEKVLLRGVSGCFKSGELTAIMGPSGAGKSTLLNVLSGYIKDGVKGELYANGRLQDGQRRDIKAHSGYILQDDHFNPCFSVAEIMRHAANLKLGFHINTKSKNLLIDDILDSMAMKEAENTLCSRLSGGQMKRLDVCLELINNPSILYLDEPTSGLDSLSCSLLIRKLKALARSGRTIICTIHQPSAGIFSQFDHLYLVSKGRNVYQGDPANIIPFLRSAGLECPVFHNPADFVMDVITGEFGNHSESLLAASKNNNWRTEQPKLKQDKNKKTMSNGSLKNDRVPSEWTRYRCLVAQIIRHLHRDWTMSYLKLVLHIAIGMTLGFLYKGFGKNGARVLNNLSYFFVCCLYLGFTSIMPAALKFPSEMKVLKKEHFNNWYKFRTFFLAFITVHLPLQIIYGGAFTIVSYVLTEQMLEMWRFSLFSAAITFNILISEFIGITMGTMKDPVNGVFNGSILVAVLSLLGGFFVFLKDFPSSMYLVSFVGSFRYVFEILAISQYGIGRGRVDCPENIMYCHFRSPELITEELIGLDEDFLWRDIVVLFFYTIGVALIAFHCVRYRLKKFTT